VGTRFGASQHEPFRAGRTELTLKQEPDELFETVSQALLNAVDRDALSGWGAHVYIIEKDKVTKRLLKGRQD
jgi:20S proteasome alpha/beta subunit